MKHVHANESNFPKLQWILEQEGGHISTSDCGNYFLPGYDELQLLCHQVISTVTFCSNFCSQNHFIRLFSHPNLVNNTASNLEMGFTENLGVWTLSSFP